MVESRGWNSECGAWNAELRTKEDELTHHEGHEGHEGGGRGKLLVDARIAKNAKPSLGLGSRQDESISS